MTPTGDQARLEGAIFDRFPSLAFGHTPGSVERAIEYVEPYERLLVIHPGPDLNIRQLAWRINPSFEGGCWANGIPALRHGPSNRGVVLFQEGIDATVVLAGVSDRDWSETITSFANPDDDLVFLTGGPVTPEEAASIATDRSHETPYGSILARRIGALYSLPHLGINIYNRTPGRVLEITQQSRDNTARRHFIRTMEEAGLELVEEESNDDHLTFLPSLPAKGWPRGRARRTGRVRTKGDAPLLVRLAPNPVSFPDVRAGSVTTENDARTQLAS
ncbi:hypothetical protein EDF27_2800 [Curtobacterium sp. PhB136]|nr:hypothetical protein EDF27_2800 [Curtobacterium sp. PhB136]